MYVGVTDVAARVTFGPIVTDWPTAIDAVVGEVVRLEIALPAAATTIADDAELPVDAAAVTVTLPEVAASPAWFRGHLKHLPIARVTATAAHASNPSAQGKASGWRGVRRMAEAEGFLRHEANRETPPPNCPRLELFA